MISLNNIIRRQPRPCETARAGWLAAAILPLLAGAAAAGTIHETDPDTGLEAWRHQGREISLEFIQRLPDQSRAYFQGRGFSPEDAEPIAASCIFQTIIRNTAPPGGGDVVLDLSRWEVRPAQGTAHPPKLEKAWEPEWETREVPQAARIAFRWSLFPSHQRFAPGDWNMGMVSMDLPVGARFDLEVRWTRDGEPRSMVIPDMRCAPDRHI